MRKVFISVIVLFVVGTSFTFAAKPSDFNLKDGDLVSAIFSDDPDVYIINEHGYKRLFLNPEIFKFYGHLGGFASVKLITSEVRDAFPTVGLFRNCEKNDDRVYGFESEGEDKGKLRWVDSSSEQAVKDDPDFFKKVFCINDKEFKWYKKGEELKSVKEVPQYHRVATPAIPAIPAIPASPSQPIVSPTITSKPASSSFTPTPTIQPATPAIPATPAQPATSSTPTPMPVVSTSPSPTASSSYSPSPSPSPSPTPTPTPTPTPVPTYSLAFSNQSITDITPNSATILFTTNVPAAAKVSLFICTSTSSSTSCQSQNIFWEPPNSGFSPYTYISGAHSIPVSYLKNGTTYTFQVDAFDSSYYTISYKDTFTTPTSTSSMPSNFNRDLYLGITGSDVKQLQALLINEVNYPANLITGYFGNTTSDAVKRLQEKYGVKPISGYFGEITRKVLQSLTIK